MPLQVDKNSNRNIFLTASRDGIILISPHQKLTWQLKHLLNGSVWRCSWGYLFKKFSDKNIYYLLRWSRTAFSRCLSLMELNQMYALSTCLCFVTNVIIFHVLWNWICAGLTFSSHITTIYHIITIQIVKLFLSYL